jgi:hypothetical protein
MNDKPSTCVVCGAAGAGCFQLFNFGAVGEPGEEHRLQLCVRCARAERRKSAESGGDRLKEPSSDGSLAGVTRAELIAELDRFFAESGAQEVCRRCHEQGTGCCPQACRALTESGCAHKNLFCATFMCGALLSAIGECDRRAARLLKWAKRELGPAEFRVYEMMTRVPQAYREEARPLLLPARYPGPLGVSDGRAIAPRLLALTDEVLEVRRRWSVVVDDDQKD